MKLGHGTCFMRHGNIDLGHGARPCEALDQGTRLCEALDGTGFVVFPLCSWVSPQLCLQTVSIQVRHGSARAFCCWPAVSSGNSWNLESCFDGSWLFDPIPSVYDVGDVAK